MTAPWVGEVFSYFLPALIAGAAAGHQIGSARERKLLASASPQELQAVSYLEAEARPMLIKIEHSIAAKDPKAAAIFDPVINALVGIPTSQAPAPDPSPGVTTTTTTTTPVPVEPAPSVPAVVEPPAHPETVVIGGKTYLVGAEVVTAGAVP